MLDSERSGLVSPRPTPAGEALLTVAEVASFLRVPVATLYAWRHRSVGPPALRIGRHLRYRAADVHRWFRDR